MTNSYILLQFANEIIMPIPGSGSNLCQFSFLLTHVGRCNSNFLFFLVLVFSKYLVCLFTV